MYQEAWKPQQPLAAARRRVLSWAGYCGPWRRGPPRVSCLATFALEEAMSTLQPGLLWWMERSLVRIRAAVVEHGGETLLCRSHGKLSSRLLFRRCKSLHGSSRALAPPLTQTRAIVDRVQRFTEWAMRLRALLIIPRLLLPEARQVF